MKNIYEFNDLNDCIKYQFRIRKLNFSRVSHATDIHPSYFSRVMKAKASFSQNQIFKIGNFLKLEEEEVDFLFLLLQKQLAGNPAERQFFEKRIRRVQNEKLNISRNMDAKVLQLHGQTGWGDYYTEAMTTMVHMYLTMPEYQKMPTRILEKLNLTQEKLSQELGKLQSLGIIEMKGSKIIAVRDSIHLAEESPWSAINHINWRLKSIQQLEQRTNDKSNYHLSAVFTLDEETKHLLKQKLRQLALEAKLMVDGTASSDRVCKLIVDLF